MPSWVLWCLEGQTRLQTVAFKGRCPAEGRAGAKRQERTDSLVKLQEVYQVWGVRYVRLFVDCDLRVHCTSLPPVHGVQWMQFRENLLTGSFWHCEKFAFQGLSYCTQKPKATVRRKTESKEKFKRICRPLLCLQDSFFSSNPTPQRFRGSWGNRMSLLNALKKKTDHTRWSYLFSGRLAGKPCDNIQYPRVPFAPRVWWRKSTMESDTQVQVLTSWWPGCMALGKPSGRSGPQCPHL